MNVFEQFRQDEKPNNSFPQAIIEHQHVIKTTFDDFTDREEDVIEDGNFVKRFITNVFVCGCGKLLSFETATKLKPPVAKCPKCNAPLCADCHRAKECKACKQTE